MKIKTNELQDAALDWAVNQIEECCDDPHTPLFSSNWAQGGAIIEGEGISLDKVSETMWIAFRREGPAFSEESGPTPLIAAMRCFVASKLGDEVEVPDELVEGETE
jgi:hypothetical protein